MRRRSRRSAPSEPTQGPTLGPPPAGESAEPAEAASVHEDDRCHWYYDGGVVCAPDGSQDFVTVTTDRAVFDELDAAGRACPDCVAMVHA
ncbi:hypothetical protein [Nocardioides endophyticus]